MKMIQPTNESSQYSSEVSVLLFKSHGKKLNKYIYISLLKSMGDI